MLAIREYSHTVIKEDINFLTKKYPLLETCVIGKSVLGCPIHALALGNEKAKLRVFFNAAHHGLEWMTSWILMNFVSDLCDSKQILRNCRLFFVPMVNPDGVEIALSGVKWQANANGVDLNHNYPANWQPILDKPNWTRYGGPQPCSEPETRAMVAFTKESHFSRVIALHSQGEEIFWDFNDIHIPGALELAEKMSFVSGYKVAAPEPLASFGGYKDYFIQTFRRPGYTIELGLGENPLPLEKFQKIYDDIREMLLVCAS